MLSTNETKTNPQYYLLPNLYAGDVCFVIFDPKVHKRVLAGLVFIFT